jgi:TRAP-type C4-dicarboxylate transport system permease small subunit
MTRANEERVANTLDGVANTLDRIVEHVDRLARAFVVFLVVAVTTTMLAQVFFRKVLNSSLQWSEELSLFGLVWLVLIGAVVLMRNWEHINIPTFIRLLPAKRRAWFIGLSKVATIIFLAILVWYGFDVFFQNFHGTSPTLGISTKWAKLSIPVGSLLMVIFAINTMLRDAVEYHRKNYDHFDKQGKPGTD